MTCCAYRPLALAVSGLLLIPVLGCAFATDLINPDLLLQVGLDPGTVLPPSGKIVIAFNNQTDRMVRFRAYALDDADNVMVGSVNLWVGVAPGEVSSEAVDCPVAAVSPGRVNDDFSIDSVGATYDYRGAQPTAVTYTGSPVFGERGDFVCGDMIEIRLIQTADAGGGEDDQDTQAQFEFRVQVHPGR